TTQYHMMTQGEALREIERQGEGEVDYEGREGEGEGEGDSLSCHATPHALDRPSPAPFPMGSPGVPSPSPSPSTSRMPRMHALHKVESGREGGSPKLHIRKKGVRSNTKGTKGTKRNNTVPERESERVGGGERERESRRKTHKKVEFGVPTSIQRSIPTGERGIKGVEGERERSPRVTRRLKREVLAGFTTDQL
ncbi:hypothetical protein KIPB_012759, partial [Kipferlia bialata]